MKLCIVTGNSMSPTMPDGTIFVTSRPSTRKLKRGRVVIFGDEEKDELPMVKRIIGCPGSVGGIGLIWIGGMTRGGV